MATTYSSRFYNSDGTVKPGFPYGTKGFLGTEEFNETIATTVTDGTDEHYLMPGDADGKRQLLGFWRKSGDMDTGGPTLDADIVFRTVLNGVTTDTMIYDSSASGLFSAAQAMEWLSKRITLPQADDGVGHFVFKVGTAATTPAAANLTFKPEWY